MNSAHGVETVRLGERKVHQQDFRVDHLYGGKKGRERRDNGKVETSAGFRKECAEALRRFPTSPFSEEHAKFLVSHACRLVSGVSGRENPAVLVS